VAGQSVALRLRVRRFFCDAIGCAARTFAEQVDGLTWRHGRRTSLCRSVLERIGLVLAGRAGARLAARLGLAASRGTLLGLVHALPDPEVGTVKVLGVDDFAIRRGRKYATVLIDAVTHRRVDVLPDRKSETLAAWLREHPGVQVVCRDGSAAYAEAIRQGAPKAVQASDRWHLWHNLAAAVEKCVVAHATRCNAAPRPEGSALAARTRERHAAVHNLLNQDVGLLECARRLGWSLNTVKRYARAKSVEELLRPPRYGACLADAHRDLLRRRLAEKTPVTGDPDRDPRAGLHRQRQPAGALHQPRSCRSRAHTALATPPRLLAHEQAPEPARPHPPPPRRPDRQLPRDDHARHPGARVRSHSHPAPRR
jgi:hypothetical protein